MENASRALYMAAGVLLAIMMISFAVAMFRSGGTLGSDYEQQAEQDALMKFNSQFENYHKDDNTIYDVITVANLAYDINKRNSFDPNNGVKVVISFSSAASEKSVPNGYSGNLYVLNSSNMKKNYLTSANVVDSINNNNQVSIYNNEFIDFYSENRSDDNGYTIFKWHFRVDNSEIEYNTTTGKVNSIKFSVIKNSSWY